MKKDRKGLGIEKEREKAIKAASTSDKNDSAQTRTSGRGITARIMTQRTISRKEARKEEIKNKRWETNLRRYLSE